jgi:hypothetical protein
MAFFQDLKMAEVNRFPSLAGSKKDSALPAANALVKQFGLDSRN